jgi:hypothetical protein
MAEKRKTIALDFDGVLNSYGAGYTGVEVVDDPVPGAQRFVTNLLEDGFEPVVFSARASDRGGVAAIKQWLSTHEFPRMEVTDVKPKAEVYVDDRAFRFEGNFDEALKFIHSDEAEPWTTRKGSK